MVFQKEGIEGQSLGPRGSAIVPGSPESERKGDEPGDAGRESSHRVLHQRKALGLYPPDKGELMRGFKGNSNM